MIACGSSEFGHHHKLASYWNPQSAPPRVGRISSAWCQGQGQGDCGRKEIISTDRKNSSFLIGPGEQSPAKVLFCSHLIIKTIPPLLSSLGLRAPDSLGPVIASLLIEIISIYYTKCSSLFQLSL